MTFSGRFASHAADLFIVPWAATLRKTSTGMREKIPQPGLDSMGIESGISLTPEESSIAIRFGELPFFLVCDVHASLVPFRRRKRGKSI